VRVSSLFGALEKLLKGDPSARTQQQYAPQVAAVNAFAPACAALSDDELKVKTAEFRDRLAGGATLDSLLPEAFAVRLASLLARPAATFLSLASLRLCARPRSACWACGRSMCSSSAA
jgi:hypothetical protein